jgi:hypothetical protein
MKKLFLSAVIVMAIGFTATAQTAPVKEKKAAKKEKKAALKDHVCTDGCHKAGKCVMVHGEKGHKCGEACKKAA